MKITRILLAMSATFSLAACLAIPATSQAADGLKGAQLQIGERPATVSAQTVAVTAPEKTLACGSCTNATKPFATSAGRGAFVKTGVITTHECPGCKTTITTSGAGKARIEVANHTCGSGTVASCCSGMAGM